MKNKMVSKLVVMIMVVALFCTACGSKENEEAKVENIEKQVAALEDYEENQEQSVEEDLSAEEEADKKETSDAGKDTVTDTTSSKKDNTATSSKKNNAASTGSNSNKNNNATSGGNSGSSSTTSTGSSSSTTTNHTHTWEDIYEDQKVVDQAAYTESIPVYEKQAVVICCCGARFNTAEEWDVHTKSYIAKGDYSHGSYSVTSKDVLIRTDTITHKEQSHIVHVKVGSKCSGCGATK